MLVCDLVPPILFLLVMTSSATQTTTRTVLSACNSSGLCPAQSSCTFRHPDGHLCICNEGFAASSNMTVCEKAVYLNEGCKSACAGLFTICDETSKKCVCYGEYVKAADGKNCIEAGMGLLGGACGSGCAFRNEQVCVDGVCRCKMDSRPMTEEEIRAFSNPQSQCISSTYRLEGTTLPPTITATKKGPTPPPSPATTVTTTALPPTVPFTTPIRATPFTDAPTLGGSTSTLQTQAPDANQTQLPDGTYAEASRSSGMRTGMAVGISLAILVTLIALGVVVVVRKRKTQGDGHNSSENGLGSKSKNPEVRATGFRDSCYFTESTTGGDGGTSLSSPATGTIPDVLVHSTDIRSSTCHYDTGSHLTDGQDGTDADDVRLSDGKMEGAKLPSRQDHSVVYSNFKIKENKAKKFETTKAPAEASPPDDTTYNTLSIANVKSRGDESNHKEDYNTLYNMKV